MENLKVSVDGVKFGTNILKVKVPKHLRTKVATGVPYFDAAMGGEGFTPSTVTLFTGDPGSGKTTLMLTVADALTENGYQVVYNSGEESLFQVKLTAERLQLTSGFRAGGLTNVEDLLEECDKLRKRSRKPIFLIVDSLQVMTDNGRKSKNLQAGRILRTLINWAKTADKHGLYPTVLVINQVTKSGDMAGANYMAHDCDARLHLAIERKNPELMGARVLTTKKNRFGGAGHIFFLGMHEAGFVEIARETII